MAGRALKRDAPVRKASKREAARRHAVVRRQAAYAGAAGALVVAVVAAALAFPPAPYPNGIISYAHMHLHPHLKIFRLGANFTVPAEIGINKSAWNFHALDNWSLNGPSFCPLHTHDTTGTIHVESTVTRHYTLGEFFLVWGQPFGPTRVLGFKADGNHTLRMTVNGEDSTAWGNLVLEDQQEVAVHLENATRPVGT